jgi:hypothetical protein
MKLRQSKKLGVATGSVEKSRRTGAMNFTSLTLPGGPHASFKFRQQQLSSCRPFLTPLSTAVLYTVIFLVCAIIAISYRVVSRNLLHLVFDYTHCQTSNCTINFTVQNGVSGPFLVFYKLSNMLQNHFLYSQSKDWKQLEGVPRRRSQLASCKPMVANSSGQTFVPCGAVPLSVFNDTFTFSQNFPDLSRTGTSVGPFRNQFHLPPESPNDDNWLNNSELFPGGQTDERFVEWVRSAPFPTFLKLWGRSRPEAWLIAGMRYSVEVTNNYPVDSFDGTKSLIVAQSNSLGMKGKGFAPLFGTISGIAVVLSAAFWATWIRMLRSGQAETSAGGDLQSSLL